jgi:hypothetical protein
MRRQLTRRGRRRLFVIATAGLLGLSVPAWVPRLLATLPAFRVEQIEVIGTRYIPPDEVKALVALGPEASVWDDLDVWEARVRSHPMIRDATVRRNGLHALQVVVVEKRPVALVATPELRPVNADGHLLPLDASRAELDLPIIHGLAEVDGDEVVDPDTRRIARLLDALDRAQPEFLEVVSEVGYAEDGGYEFLMLPRADAGTVLLPTHDPVRALRRISFALGRVDDPRVGRADARFAGQVVLTREGGR